MAFLTSQLDTKHNDTVLNLADAEADAIKRELTRVFKQ